MSAHFVNLLDELQRRSLRMANAVRAMVEETCDALARGDAALARRIVDRDSEIDQEEVAVEAEALRLMTLFQPMGRDMRLLCTIIKANTDLERVADCAVNVAQRTYHLPTEAAIEAGADLAPLIAAVQAMLGDAVRAYAMGEPRIALRIREQDDAVDAFYGQFMQKLVADPASSPEAMAIRLDVLSIAKNLERIADHATNIAEDVVYLVTGEIVRHGRRSPERNGTGPPEQPA